MLLRAASGSHLLEAVWQHMPVLLVGAITNVGHLDGALELSANTKTAHQE